MNRVILAVLLGAGLAPLAFTPRALAAGGGASSGGSDAQNHPANGLPPGQPGPPGSNNNPSRTGLPPDARNDRTAPPAAGSAPAPR